jgi:acetyl-CoA C-acetyltransferase
MSAEALIYYASRTPRGRGKETGALHSIRPIDLLRVLFDDLRDRCALDTVEVDDVILGCVTPVGEQGGDIGRTAPLVAGWDLDTPGMQINRFCASGLEAVNLAAMKVRSGWERLVVAGGVESMSRVPMGSDGWVLADDPEIADRLGFVPQGISADLIATLGGFSREMVDALALESQQRAARATQRGFFKSIVPVTEASGAVLLAHDEHMRPTTTMADLAGLKPAFAAVGERGFDAIALRAYPALERIAHVHTAGNSSGIVDGAALLLVGSADKGRALGLTPRARVRAAAIVGAEPTIMLTGPAPATRKALRLAGMSLDDIDLIEVNEAFAAVVLRFMHDMDLDNADRVNVNGGAIALGHPLGATGAVLLGTLLDELERRDLETGLVTLCAGGGMGIATIVERV